jgi:acetyl-CoA carboxylase, biotin carboxylase subunit
MITKILIANRGEIAIRIIRACRHLGIGSVVIFSDVDRTALHVRMADEAYHIGRSPAAESYLVGDRIIDVTLKAGADAIHPGYGFLAENWQFARAVNDAGLIFIGPPPEAIRLLGDKLQARHLAEKAGVPVVPGGSVHPGDIEHALAFAGQCGYPVLVKAVAGGGGKGMRIVAQPDELAKALATAGSEAKSAFGDDRVFVEKYISRPRHIEIQVARDRFGNAVYLGERECSIQRRHQKLIEEAPSVFVTEELRHSMGEIALKAITAANYENLGTVEFLVDNQRNFYFLEVNTRLQVEHPVTELVTGIDLVKEQIRIASGEKLSFGQDEVQLRGHAIECRICAEDPVNDFLPSAGRIVGYRMPAGPGVRVDSGVRNRSEVPAYYDSLLAKLITYGADRDEAIQRMRQALAEFRISGVGTNICFHESVMEHPVFLAGRLSTNFVAEHFSGGRCTGPPDFNLTQAAAVAAALHHYYDAKEIRQITPTLASATRWGTQSRLDGLRTNRGSKS